MLSARRLLLSADRVLLCSVALGLVARLVVLALFPDPQLPDAATYLRSGQAFFATGFIEAHIYMPLYPIWAALWGPWWRLADVATSAGTVVLVYWLARAMFNDILAARLAALGAAVYPHFLFYAVSGLSETLYLALLIFAFLFYYRGIFVLGHVFIALSILTRPVLDLAAPLIILLFVHYVHGQPWRDVGRNVLHYAIIYVVLMAPWWLHNYQRYGQFVRLNLGDGVVLYSGNNLLNQSGGGVTGSLKGEDLSFEKFEDIADPVARNEAMKTEAVAYIKANPWRFVEMAGVKLVRFWRLWPYAPEYENFTNIAASLASFGPVLVGTLAFLFRASRAALLRVSPVLFIAAFLTAVHMVTIGSIRYRLPLEPFMIVLASVWAAPLLSKLAVTERVSGGRRG